MSISRLDLKGCQHERLLLYSGKIAVFLPVAAVLFLRLKPAVPIEEGPTWTDTVERGLLLRQVRGPGSLVPREDRIRLIPAETE